jgi:hypothetical protein
MLRQTRSKAIQHNQRGDRPLNAEFSGRPLPPLRPQRRPGRLNHRHGGLFAPGSFLEQQQTGERLAANFQSLEGRDRIVDAAGDLAELAAADPDRAEVEGDQAGLVRRDLGLRTLLGR